MSVQFTFGTSATLVGAQRLNRMHRAAAQVDLAFKLEKMISAINDTQSAVSALNIAVSNIQVALLSGMTATAIGVSGIFSALSGAGSFTSTGTTLTRTALQTVSAISNFSAS